ncbi:TlpA family protein disulfide reductase [Candidatus Poribacteria bacterium]|nr:TlpA family protein disulfide reductase [Candidatus Poribacteria bacterium]
MLGNIQQVFEVQFKLTPDDWNNTKMLVEIHEVLGNTAEVQAVFQRLQLVLKDRLKQNPDDRNAWRGLADVHEKLGNSELAHAYRVNADPTLAWVGKILPDFSSAVDLDGKPISLADYRGKVVLLDFWTTEYTDKIQTLEAVYTRYHHRGFDIIGINLDVDETVLREFIAENPLPWRQIFDGKRYEGPLAQQYGVHSTWRMFLLDREGKVISVNVRDRILNKFVAEEIAREMD